jgi:hypothetical protein
MAGLAAKFRVVAGQCGLDELQQVVGLRGPLPAQGDHELTRRRSRRRGRIRAPAREPHATWARSYPRNTTESGPALLIAAAIRFLSPAAASTFCTSASTANRSYPRRTTSKADHALHCRASLQDSEPWTRRTTGSELSMPNTWPRSGGVRPSSRPVGGNIWYSRCPALRARPAGHGAPLGSGTGRTGTTVHSRMVATPSRRRWPRTRLSPSACGTGA